MKVVLDSRILVRALFAALVAVLPACGSSADDVGTSDEGAAEELGVGDVEGSSAAATSYKYATTCKPIPTLTKLKSPSITVSLDGLTLHLKDLAGTYDKVFKVGVGKIENGKSLTPVSTSASGGTFFTSSSTSTVADSGWGYWYPCRIWWTDPANGQRSPVFAGLPFIRLTGAPTTGYGIHGPIDSYDSANGGSLRRGYVSHGCIRMAAEDIVEVYALIQGIKAPVKVQQAVERLSDGTAVDVASKWIGAECKRDADCNYTGGTCYLPADGSPGTCTQACTSSCPDTAGEATTFCSSAGRCVPQSSSTYNDSCRRYRGRLDYASTTRPDRSKTATVCQP
jgi:lipoprotein-anchoring transpeptidase ErfK/SrfK